MSAEIPQCTPRRREALRPFPCRGRRAPSLLLAALALLAWPAHADNRIQLGLDTFGLWLPNMPATISSDTVTHSELRDVPAGTLRLGGSNVLVGGGITFGVALREHWVLDIGGFEGGGSVARTASVLGSLDGSIVEVKPWAGALFGIRLPGFGYRVTHRRWQLQMRLASGYEVVRIPIAVSVGATTVGQTVSADSFVVRGEGDLCYRVDYQHRACLFVAANLYEFSAGNGGSVGLRWEVGR